jgi:hypothetical protein
MMNGEDDGVIDGKGVCVCVCVCGVESERWWSK